MHKTNAILLLPARVCYWTAMLSSLPVRDGCCLPYYKGMYRLGSRLPPSLQQTGCPFSLTAYWVKFYTCILLAMPARIQIPVDNGRRLDLGCSTSLLSRLPKDVNSMLHAASSTAMDCVPARNTRCKKMLHGHFGNGCGCQPLSVKDFLSLPSGRVKKLVMC
jgi:hypothetical protein